MISIKNNIILHDGQKIGLFYFKNGMYVADIEGHVVRFWPKDRDKVEKHLERGLTVKG